MTTSTAEDSSLASSTPIPRGWTNVLPASAAIKQMLSSMTSLPGVQLRLGEVKGSQYLFQSTNKYYFWNTVTEEGAEVVDPKDYDKLLAQMDRDITKVQVTQLREPEGLE